ncbi:Flavin-dependent halogenase malA [Paramyrothecium foliicola]|nr:Flavin-dependent halogenase malA [Paramyrothecium foliicola]
MNDPLPSAITNLQPVEGKHAPWSMVTALALGGLSSSSYLWRKRGESKALNSGSEIHVYKEYPSDDTFLNSQNLQPNLPSASDVVVVGGGIHSLIYAIHTRLRSQSLFAADPSVRIPSITVLERQTSPGYKIGESTLTTFGVWLKSIGISTSVLWRLFGAKDGLAFYYLPADGSWDGVASFCANGPRGDFVATLQIERKISELLLTIYAQRLGVKVFHGMGVDVAATQTKGWDAENGGSRPRTGQGEMDRSSVREENLPGIGRVKLTNGKQISTKMLVDATGRFRRFASKEARSKRFEGFNTDSFWAYFEMEGDESELPFENYESCHTNHICLAEGWAWLIRLPTWEGSSIPNLTAMINYLLDLNELNTPSDDYPSMEELARKFNCKVRWVTSIGYALRSDVPYPPEEELEKYGSCEAERRFNWVTAKYPRMQAYMDRHRLVQDLYGKNTTWFIRKHLTYGSPVVSGMPRRADDSTGMMWAAIGDAAGFTNPLYSPGINCNMATSVLLAEKTPFLLSRNDAEKQKSLSHYNEFCADRVVNLHRMNVYNYVLMQSPKTGPLGPLWQYLSGTGNEKWRRSAEFVSINRVAEFVTTWEWGSQHPEYIAFAKEAIRLLSGSLRDGPPDAAKVEEVLQISRKMLADAKKSGKYHNRWAGLFSWYDDELQFDGKKVGRDKLAVRCEGCGNWRILTGVSRKCCTCGVVCNEVEITRY